MPARPLKLDLYAQQTAQQHENERPPIGQQVDQTRVWWKSLRVPIDRGVGCIPPEALLWQDVSLLGLKPGCLGQAMDARSLVFLDTETTGLGAGGMVFLVGLAYFEGDSLVIEQLLGLDFPGEAGVLDALAKRLAGSEAVVTFNGATFDLPMLKSRAVLARQSIPYPQLQIDLYQLARRIFSKRLPRMGQQALEENVLGYRREGDLAGSEIPGRYFRFLKERDQSLLEDILRHNALDVQNMVSLAAVLCGMLADPLGACTHPEDIYCIARLYQRAGDKQKARALYAAVQDGLDGAAREALALMFRREKRYEDAFLAWQDMASAGQGGAGPYVEMAKYWEHRERNYGKALACAQKALACANAMEREDILWRIARLQQKEAKTCP
nr:ribonuclease H-like domain-containing protein [bacterium]